MRQREACFFEDDVFDEQGIEIDRPWGLRLARSNAPELLLDLEQCLQELCRREGGAHRGRAVEESRLVEITDRIGLAERRDRHDLDAASLVEELDGALERRSPIAEVRSEADVRTGHAPNVEANPSGHCETAYNSRRCALRPHSRWQQSQLFSRSHPLLPHVETGRFSSS